MGNVASQPPSESRLTGRPPLRERPVDIIKLNDSVWELCPTQGVPQVEVVFFHGLQLSNYEEGFWKTWLSRDETVVWPKDWLNDSLGRNGIQARILSISYNSCARRHDKNQDLYEIVGNLIEHMIHHALIGQNCPVILVGHSLGGIIIKQVLLRCVKEKNLWRNRKTTPRKVARLENFLNNCKGVFYYSAPFFGSRLVDYAARIPFQQFNDSLITLLKPFSKETARINEDFRIAEGNFGGGYLKTWAVGESLDTTFMGLRARVVEEASARQGVNQFYTAKEADHIQVCKPTNRDDIIFTTLVRFVNYVWESEMNAAG